MFYNQYYNPYGQQAAQMPAQQQSNGMIWVSSEEEADKYLMAPNTIIPFWDRNVRRIYIKQADASGITTKTILDYTVKAGEPAVNVLQPQKENDYVTRADWNTLQEHVTALEQKLSKEE